MPAGEECHLRSEVRGRRRQLLHEGAQLRRWGVRRSGVHGGADRRREDHRSQRGLHQPRRGGGSALLDDRRGQRRLQDGHGRLRQGDVRCAAERADGGHDADRGGHDGVPSCCLFHRLRRRDRRPALGGRGGCRGVRDSASRREPGPVWQHPRSRGFRLLGDAAREPRRERRKGHLAGEAAADRRGGGHGGEGDRERSAPGSRGGRRVSLLRRQRVKHHRTDPVERARRRGGAAGDLGDDGDGRRADAGRRHRGDGRGRRVPLLGLGGHRVDDAERHPRRRADGHRSGPFVGGYPPRGRA